MHIWTVANSRLDYLLQIDLYCHWVLIKNNNLLLNWYFKSKAQLLAYILHISTACSCKNHKNPLSVETRLKQSINKVRLLISNRALMLTTTVGWCAAKAGPFALSYAHWLMSFWLLLPLFLLFSQIGFYWVRVHIYVLWVLPVSRLQSH